MERLNMKSVSILIVISIFLNAGSARAIVQPIQEQKECIDSRCPNVNFGPGKAVPSFPNSKGGLRIPVYGNAFVPPPTVTPGTEVLIGGQAVDWDTPIILPPGGTLEIQDKPSEILIPSDWALRVGIGQSVDQDFIIFVAPGGTLDMMNSAGAGQAAPSFSSGRGGVQIPVYGSGFVPPTTVTPGTEIRVAGSTGNMYINSAYGTTRADVPICDCMIITIAPGGTLDMMNSAGGNQAIDFICRRANPGIPMVRFYVSGAGGSTADDFYDPDIIAVTAHIFEIVGETGKPSIINMSLGEHTGPLDDSDALELEVLYSTQKGLRTLKPEPEFCLHYDSGKADGSVGQCQTVLGYGWTHNYNLYLVKEGTDVFMADGKGRMTRFKEDGMGGYISSDGQTYTLFPFGPMFVLEEVDGATMTFQQPMPSPEWAYGKDVYLVTRIEDARGRTMEFFYNSVTSLLETITDPYGRQVQLTYTDYADKKLLHTVTAPDMQTTMIEYQAGGDKLWRVTDPEGNTLIYNYDGSGRMTTVQLKDGNIWTCEYNSGVPWRIKDPNDDVYVTITNSNNWARNTSHPDSDEYRYLPSVTTITDGEGNVTSFDLNENGYVTAVGHTGYPDKSFTFDGNLHLTEVTDQAGNHWQYEYDSNGNLTDVNDPLANHTERLFEHPTIASLCTKMIDPDGDIWRFEYDSGSNLTKITDPIIEFPNDAVTSFSYTYFPGFPYGRFQTVTRTDRNGHVTQLELDPSGNIVRTITDPCGLDLTTEYEYDPVGRITRKTRFREAGGPNTVVTTYTYDSMGRLIESILDSNLLNLTTQYEYDGCNRITKVTHPRGTEINYDYDYRGRLVGRTFDPYDLALNTGYSYDGCDRRITKTDAKGNITNYEYNSLNRLIKIVNSEGYWTEYQYDDRSNLTYDKRSIDPVSSPYRIIKYEYDSLNRLVQITADPCDLALATQIDYSPSGGGSGGGGYGTSGTSIVHKVTNPEGKITYYYYDQLDRLISIVDKVGDTSDNGGDSDDAITNYEYDPVGNKIEIVIENAPKPNLVTEYIYDTANRLIKQIVSPADANLVTSYTYDGTSNIVTQTTPVGNVITYSYDSANRLTDLSDLIGPVTGYSHDENGNLISQSDGLGHTWTYSYDNADRIIESHDPLIESPTDRYANYEYDKNSNLVKETDNEGLVTDYEYDSLNRLIAITKDPCGLGVTTTYSYDGCDNRISATDDNGNTTTYEYDGLNRLIREEFADETQVLFTYDGADNLITETDQMGNITGYTYDDLNRLITRSYADGSSDSFTYDRAGQLLVADNNNSHIGYTYDGAGRIVTDTQTNIPQTYSYVVGYTYTTEPNNTRKINYPDGNEITETYDVRSRLARVEQNDNTIALYAYDDPGNRLLTKTFGNGTVSLYSYNDNGWITTLVHKDPDDSNLTGYEYEYDSVGNRIISRNLLTYDINKPATHSAVCSYDSIYRLTGFKQGQWVGGDIPSALRQRNWTLDGVNNWQQFTILDNLDTGKSGSYCNSINQMNEYDDASTNGLAPVPDDDGKPDDFMVNTNPLSGDLQPDGEVNFNDLSVMALYWLYQDCILPGSCGGADLDDSNDVDLIDFALFAGNWLDSTPGFYNSAHDKNGNLVDDDIYEYFWDYDHRSIDTATLRARNLLTQVKRKSNDQIIVEYFYDVLGRRIGRTTNGINTVFIYDGWRVISEYDDGTFTHSYIYGEEIDEVLVMLDAPAIPSYYHAGVQGSIIAVTDATAVVSECYNYDAYGQPHFCDGDGHSLTGSAIGNSYLFTGRRYDDESGLYYYRTRYLHPRRGRFISGDVLDNWGDTFNLGNNFCYVGDNPQTHTDPFGLQAGVKFGPPKGPKRRRYNFRFKATPSTPAAQNVIISSRDALKLKKGTPAAELLQRCTVIIISGTGYVSGKKG